MDPSDGMSGFCIRSRSGGGGGGAAKCGRWNPTTEQVRVLTELFRAGLRTPSTDQIQKISSELSFYGKIESKNVFYWFQNHKARERQKRRRVLVVDEDKDHEIVNREERASSTRHFAEINQVSEPERVMETLQLFPLNSTESESEKLNLFTTGAGKENSSFSFTFSAGDMDRHPPLDLRLSFF